ARRRRGHPADRFHSRCIASAVALLGGRYPADADRHAEWTGGQHCGGRRPAAASAKRPVMVTRLDPLPPGHTPELKDQFDSFRKSLGFVPNSVLTMQRSPKLVRAFVALQAAVWGPDSEVDRGLKRLIAHLSSRSAGDAYSMAHTASGALHFGVEPRKLAAIADYATSPLF